MFSIYYTDRFKKDFRKLDRSIQQLIKNWIERNLVNSEDPRLRGKPLVANLKGCWRYRIGDYRLLVEIVDRELTIIAISVSHMSEVYNESR